MSHRRNILLLAALWAVIFLASIASPPLLDDADATHAEAAQAMLHTHSLVTLRVDGVRYLEKAPLPYWIAAASMGVFGENTFAIHLPLALTALLLALLGYRWAGRAWGVDTGFLTALFTLTSVGVFLFTRVFIPDAELALLLACSLYSFLRSLQPGEPRARLHAYLFWVALALAVLTKGLVALVFIFGAVLIFCLLTRTKPWAAGLRDWVNGAMLLLLIAAPWHVLAGRENTGGADGHGFFWFYFVNEHVLRFLGRRTPRDYNKLPAIWYWTLHLVWLFPWSLSIPAAVAESLRKPREPATAFARDTRRLLMVFAGLVLIFFSLSTNQEYYTFPAYLPLLMLIAKAIAQCGTNRWLTASFAAFAVIGLAVSAVLLAGLYTSRHLPFNPDIGSALAHRDVGNYTLSLSHFFDLTGASFAALRLPATIAALAFAVGPIIAMVLYRRTQRPHPALLAVALTMTTVLIAAHIAFARFAPMLSSERFAADIVGLESQHRIEGGTEVALFGDQAFGSSIPFYLQRRVLLIDGRSTSMLFGSTFPDAPPVFVTHDQYFAAWGKGPRKILFVPESLRASVPPDLRTVTLDEQSGKLLLTDRPLSLSEASSQ